MVTRHVGCRMGAVREIGVNDVVYELYPEIALQYGRMHSASGAVRYGDGLADIEGRFVIADLDHIFNIHAQGRLVYR